ncbi:MAG: HAD hydrolase-like protein [Deltaproteobacteria bacterium]|nr:HAD hydrolase-like protein [Deltaproteobacteria bacterium]
MPRRRPRLVLFDIDGTLIDPDGAGRKSISRVFQDMFSVKDAFRDIRMSGKTDIQIIKEGLSLHRLDKSDETLDRIRREYVRTLKSVITSVNGRLLPGVKDLLNTLKSRDGYCLGLLTGNIRQGARIKLGAFNLNSYFPFGAFGDDNEDRNRLLPIFLDRFKKMTGLDVDPGDCLVIGDTPSDVRCSKPHGAVSVAVATGPYTYESLLETGADYVLKDLTGALNVVKELTNS